MQRYFKIRFSIVIFLMIILAGASIYFLFSVNLTTKKMYEHPYRVSNELKSIELSVHHIDLLLLEQVTPSRYFKIAQEDAANKERLSIIYTQYLGEKVNIAELEDAYSHWFSLALDPESSRANREQSLVLLEAKLKGLASFADAKATGFYTQATSDTLRYAITIAIALSIASLVSVSLLMFTLKLLRENLANRKQYSQIIDQNVMISAIDDQGLIFEVSNHLSRFLSKKKEDMQYIHIKDLFFSHNEPLFDEMWKCVVSGESWQGDIEVYTDEISPKWLEIDVIPMQTVDYQYSGFRLLAYDITSQKSLEKISLTDSLTGLLNRRSLDDIMERQTRLTMRNKQPLTVAMLDIDFFKQYNDTYGHPAGDKVLTHLASLFMQLLGRPDDFIFRMGGEEFFFIFNSSCVESSKDYIGKIKDEVKRLNIENKNSLVDDVLTVSIGAVFFAGESHVEASLLMSDADDNLYKAKETRNSTVQTVEGLAVHRDV